MLSYSTIDTKALELLKYIMKAKEFQSFRLVGGAALTLQYGHRKANDLDFCGDYPENDSFFTDVLEKFGKTIAVKTSMDKKGYIVNGVKVDFFRLKYPYLDNAVLEDGLRLASPRDIAASKLLLCLFQNQGCKIPERGKDYFDLMVILQHFTIKDVFGFFWEKFNVNGVFYKNAIDVIKSIS